MQVWGYQEDFNHLSLPECRLKAAKGLLNCVKNLDSHAAEAEYLLKKYSSKPNLKIVNSIREIQEMLRIIN